MPSVKRALVAYSMSSTYVQTTFDYLISFKKFSGFEVEYIHVTHNALIDFDLNAYDIVLHNYCARLCSEGYVSDSYRQRLREFHGVKVLSVQDEYERTDTLKAAIKDLNFDIVLTCVPQDSLEYVYPRSEFPDVEFVTVFTGYVPDDLGGALPPAKPLAERAIFIGYRGRDIGGRYGRLGFDKFEIGRRMQELCTARGILTDIAMDETSRIYGTAWFDFVGDCRAMLGSESGSNVFDFDGSIDAHFKEMAAANGGVPPSYADFLPIVAARDAEIEMGQISPRIFECAIMRTPMVLFRGRYSDAIEPGEHYIALEKDFSNLDSVLQRLGDLPALEAMTQRTFHHLVGSQRFSYRSFYAGVAAAIERHYAAKNCRRAAAVISGPTLSQAALLDASDLAPERPTWRPMSREVFRMRQECGVYRSEFDRLMRRFSEIRSLFVTELLQLYSNHEYEREQFNRLKPTKTREALPSPCRLEDSDFGRLLADYDAGIAAILPQREEASAVFDAALSSNDNDAAEEALRRILEVEKGGYFAMVEWIRRIDETYNADRLNVASACTEIYHLARAAEVQRQQLFAAFRRMIAAVPILGPLAKHIAARLRSG